MRSLLVISIVVLVFGTWISAESESKSQDDKLSYPDFPESNESDALLSAAIPLVTPLVSVGPATPLPHVEHSSPTVSDAHPVTPLPAELHSTPLAHHAIHEVEHPTIQGSETTPLAVVGPVPLKLDHGFPIVGPTSSPHQIVTVTPLPDHIPEILANIPNLDPHALTEADILLANPETHTHPLGAHPLLPIHPGFDQPHSHPPYSDHPILDISGQLLHPEEQAHHHTTPTTVHVEHHGEPHATPIPHHEVHQHHTDGPVQHHGHAHTTPIPHHEPHHGVAHPTVPGHQVEHHPHGHTTPVPHHHHHQQQHLEHPHPERNYEEPPHPHHSLDPDYGPSHQIHDHFEHPHDDPYQEHLHPSPPHPVHDHHVHRHDVPHIQHDPHHPEPHHPIHDHHHIHPHDDPHLHHNLHNPYDPHHPTHRPSHEIHHADPHHESPHPHHPQEHHVRAHDPHHLPNLHHEPLIPVHHPTPTPHAHVASHSTAGPIRHGDEHATLVPPHHVHVMPNRPKAHGLLPKSHLKYPHHPIYESLHRPHGHPTPLPHGHLAHPSPYPGYNPPPYHPSPAPTPYPHHPSPYQPIHHSSPTPYPHHLPSPVPHGPSLGVPPPLHHHPSTDYSPSAIVPAHKHKPQHLSHIALAPPRHFEEPYADVRSLRPLPQSPYNPHYAPYATPTPHPYQG